ncbi:SGNH/GDSL hydrolase family protein [Mesobacillus foraminis]|uniref:SGNH/GDSL hydrolase family protein n=1 Tax=Mesobacillus foraminis TaxID=279826 RepID=UPI001BEBECE9|nr:SGNH/GDSL hydrolase family protein [Mesobacillus foraminis]MBT2756702.1 SGNH/GDSL hydrolase family protein [Mesobacillus foraminis]
MKNVLIVLLAVACVFLLVAGNLHWKEKTTVSSAKQDQNGTVSQDVNNEKETTTPGNPDIDVEELTKLTESWPNDARAQYSEALENNKPFTILLAGSNALGTEENSWSSLLKKELETAFAGTVKVVVKTYDLTSSQFIAGEKLGELTKVKPDMTLLEPFILKDNGMVTIEDSEKNITSIAAGLLEENSNHSLILQPSFPIYQATYYPLQVEALEDYANRNSIDYLDHWSSWPDPDSEEIKQYLTEDQESPNEAGHKLWADYLVNYFIAK